MLGFHMIGRLMLLGIAFFLIFSFACFTFLGGIGAVAGLLQGNWFMKLLGVAIIAAIIIYFVFVR